MQTIIVGKNDANQRVDKFIQKTIPLLPQTLMYKYIRTKHIKLNGKRCEISTRLNQGDIITFFIKDEFFISDKKEYEFLNAKYSLDIIYEDNNILIIDKKPGIVVHTDDQNTIDTLINRIQHYLYKKGEYDPAKENSFSPSLVNRIDRNTGGMVIAAKNAESLKILNQKIKNRELDKKYLCLVHGVPNKKSDTLKGYLCKNEKQNKVYIHDKPLKDGKSIITKYKLLDSNQKISLVEVSLITGRTHQIRAHMASIGHPLVGDGKYGTNQQNKSIGFKYQALYSYKLKFIFSSDSGILEYLNKKEFVIPNVWFSNRNEKIALSLIDK